MKWQHRPPNYRFNSDKILSIYFQLKMIDCRSFLQTKPCLLSNCTSPIQNTKPNNHIIEYYISANDVSEAYSLNLSPHPFSNNDLLPHVTSQCLGIQQS